MTVTDINQTLPRHLVLAICSTGLLMVGLDATIVNIALPSIHRSLGSSLAGLGVGGEGYTAFTIGTATGEGMTTARTFVRERRCALVDYFRIV